MIRKISMIAICIYLLVLSGCSYEAKNKEVPRNRRLVICVIFKENNIKINLFNWITSLI